MLLLLVCILAALGCVARGIRIHDFLCHAAGTAIAVRWIVTGATTASSHARWTGRIEDRTCRTRDEMQVPVWRQAGRRLCTCTRRSTHPLRQMLRIDERLAVLRIVQGRQYVPHMGSCPV